MSFNVRMIVLIEVLVIGLFNGCVQDPSPNGAPIEITARAYDLNSSDAGWAVQDVFVHIEKVEVIASSAESSVAGSYQTPTSQWRLVGNDPGQPATVFVQPDVYSNVDVTLFLHRDPYQLVLKDTVLVSPVEPEGPGDGEEEDDDDDGEEDDDDNDDEGDDDDDDDDDGREADNGPTGGSVGKTVDVEAFLANARPALLIFGNCVINNETVLLIAALDPGALSFNAGTAGDSLALDRENLLRIEGGISAMKMFSDVASNDLQNATLIKFRTSKLLFVHPDFNTPLYQKLVNSIPESLRVAILSGNESRGPI